MRHGRLAFLIALTTICAWVAAGRADTLIARTTATRYGLARAWFAQVGTQASTGPIRYINYDRGLLLVQTERGTLSGLDAETGRTMWSEQVGPANHSSTEPAGNEKYIAVVNGSMLFVLDRGSGRILWQRQLGGTPGAGPGVSETHVFVPMVNGRIEGYQLEAGAKQSPWIYRSAGHVLTPLVVTHEAVCWTTNKGYLYVLDPKTLSIRYRLETRGAIHSRPAYWTPNIYACSTDGCVYAVNEASGRIVWKYSVGDAIYESPVAINDRVFVVSVLGGMVCLDAKAGEPIWECPQIAQFVSLSPSRVYAIDRIGRMVILDAKTGTRLTSVPLNGVTLKLSNNECDRIYLANDANVVQCLREIDLKSPLTYIPPEPEKVEVQIKKPEKKAKAESADDSAEEPTAGDEDNPAMEAETPEAGAEGDESDPFK